MMHQHPLPMDGPALRDEAMARVERNAPDAWKTQAMEVIEDLARTRREFTSDDVWQYIDKPPSPRALGPMLRNAQRLGIIVSTGEYRRSTQRVNHARPVAVWRSRLYREG